MIRAIEAKRLLAKELMGRSARGKPGRRIIGGSILLRPFVRDHFGQIPGAAVLDP